MQQLETELKLPKVDIDQYSLQIIMIKCKKRYTPVKTKKMKLIYTPTQKRAWKLDLITYFRSMDINDDMIAFENEEIVETQKTRKDPKEDRFIKGFRRAEKVDDLYVATVI